jgi:hypothetical protein
VGLGNQARSKWRRQRDKLYYYFAYMFSDLYEIVNDGYNLQISDSKK